MNNRKNHITSSILTTAARMFTGEDGVEVECGEPRTDGRTVWIPGIKQDLTITEATLLRGYFAHESGHIKYNSFCQHAKKIIQQSEVHSDYLHEVFNGTEDVRIERLLKRHNPGCVETLNAIKTEAVRAHGDTPKKPSNLSELWGMMVHAIIWYMEPCEPPSYCRVGTEMLRKIGVDKALDRYEAELGKPDPDTLDSATAAVEIHKMIHDYLGDEEKVEEDLRDINEMIIPPMGGGEPGDDTSDDSGDESDGNPGDGPSSKSGDESDSESDESSGGTGDTKDDTDGEAKDDADGEAKDDTDGEAKSGEQEGDDFDWSADYESNDFADFSRSAIESLRDDRMTDSLNNDPADSQEDISVTAIVDSYSDRDPESRRNEHGCYLRGILDCKKLHTDALQLAYPLRRMLEASDKVTWSQPREKGHRADPRVMPQFAVGATSRVLNVKSINRAHKTIVTIILDQSTSMDYYKRPALENCLLIADACDSLRIPSGVIGFHDTCRVLKHPSERVRPNMKAGFLDDGCTNLLPALVMSNEMAQYHPRHRHVQFVLTDGSTMYSGQSAAFLRYQEECGVTSYGISIGSGGMRHHVRRFFEERNSLVTIAARDIKAKGLVSAIDSGLRETLQS